jgi:hypothetical protein
MGQIHEQTNGGDGVLQRPFLVANLYGEAQAAHADLVDPQLAVVGFTLPVAHHIELQAAFWRTMIHGHKSLFFNTTTYVSFGKLGIDYSPEWPNI